MSFNPYQNYGAGIAALGPVQAMSDRNEAQTYMANGGQMFASGGIARLAEGGDTNLLPKYKYDPATQTYVLAGADDAATAMEAELLKKKRAAEAAGGSGSYTPEKTPWDDMTNAQKAAFYAENPRMAAITQFGQKAFGWTGLGALQKAMVPDFVRDQGLIARGIDPEVARVDRINNLPTGYENVGGPGIYSRTTLSDILSGYQTGQNGLPSEIGGSAPPGSTGSIGGGRTDVSYDFSSGSTGGGLGGIGGEGTPGSNGPGDGTAADYAQGGLAALARGGMSHLGDYSDGGRLLRGPGDGVSDSIPATIGDKRPARLADGEFVVPARIVSELGNGSTEAGARKLYAMMDRIQKARKKSIGKNRVAVNSRADKNLPA
jgi:hypothetical protein